MVIAASKEFMDVGSKLSKEYEEMRAQNRKMFVSHNINYSFLCSSGISLAWSAYWWHAVEKQIATLCSFFSSEKKKYLILTNGFRGHRIVLQVMIFKMNCWKSWLLPFFSTLHLKFFTIMVDEAIDISNMSSSCFAFGLWIMMNCIVMKNSLGYIAWKIPQQKPSSTQRRHAYY